MKKKQETPPIIQSLWIGDELSVLEKLSLTSFLKNGHICHLYVYNEIKGVPEGVLLKDASQIIQPNKIFKYCNYDSYAGFSDRFRYKLLLEKGGWWVDSDVICLNPFIFDQEYVFACEMFRDTYRNAEISKVATCVIKTPAGSKIMDYCYNKSIQKALNEIYWGEVGPDLLTKAVSKFGMQQFVTNYKIFCPIPWTHFLALVSDNFDGESTNKVLSNSFAIHFWNELWRRYKINKNSIFPPNSIFELLKKRYLVSD